MKVEERELLSLEMRALVFLNRFVISEVDNKNEITDCCGNCSGNCRASCGANNADYFVSDCGGSCASTCEGSSALA